MSRPRTNEPSRRTLQRRARAQGCGRFEWTPARDRVLRRGWLTSRFSVLMLAIGCGKRALYARAAELGLPPRDPVARAIAAGEGPSRRGSITLPSVRCLDEVPA